MKRLIRALAAALATLALNAAAGDEKASVPASTAEAPLPWAFAVTAYPTAVRGGQNYTSGIATADRGALHLEARVNYESVGARSAFVGWNFSGGDTVQWEVTPLLGGAWGTTQAFIPGLEVGLAWRQFDFYSEGEYVRSRSGSQDSYLYAWSEIGWRPVQWLRVGLVGQRTRLYGNERDFQRGPLVQLTWDKLTVGGYWFNPGSDNQLFMGMISLAF